LGVVNISVVCVVHFVDCQFEQWASLEWFTFRHLTLGFVDGIRLDRSRLSRQVNNTLYLCHA